MRLRDVQQRTSGQRTVYGRRERPLVEVRLDGIWYRGRLCNQIERADGWWLYVDYRHPGSPYPRLARFAAADVRRVRPSAPAASQSGAQ